MNKGPYRAAIPGKPWVLVCEHCNHSLPQTAAWIDAELKRHHSLSDAEHRDLVTALVACMGELRNVIKSQAPRNGGASIDFAYTALMRWIERLSPEEAAHQRRAR